MRTLLRWRGWQWLLGSLLVALACAVGAAMLAERWTLSALQDEARTDARLRAALLDSEVARFRLLPLAIADDREVVAAVAGTTGANHALDRKLEALAQVTGAAVIYVVGADGVAISASNWRSPFSFVGTDYRFRRYVRDAVTRGEGSQYALGTVSRRPGLYLARRTVGGGVIVVKLEFDRIEREWARVGGGVTLVEDANGVVLVTSRPTWRFNATRPLPPRTADAIRAEMRLPADTLSPLWLKPTASGALRLDDRSIFAAAQAASNQSGWTVVHLRPARAAIAWARRTAAAATALVMLTVCALAAALRQRALLVRRRTAELEDAVAQRTAELRREMDERAESEARAADLREALRQANRLAALGQITASVAHETAQPVAAIRTYAQTSAKLLDRGDLDEVRQNLVTVARLADRIGAVTAQLRGFSRRQSGALRPVPVVEVIDGAMLILKEQMRGTVFDLPRIDPSLTVVGGKVRLEQVLVNLIQNALEALGGCAERRITLGLAADAEHVRLTVADTGPGIAPDVAGRLFTPFVTSRASGLGLGLVIAQDIMVELGGWLRLLPTQRGACFEMGMRRA